MPNGFSIQLPTKLAPNLPLDSVVSKTQILLSLHRGFLTNATNHRKNNLIKLTHYDETKKRAHT